ncbi:MAG: hypothetical protein RBS39_08670 [Phycisphaerales bacterium]|nr:hypothetical protein [Phycisphaerales bacterium]
MLYFVNEQMVEAETELPPAAPVVMPADAFVLADGTTPGDALRMKPDGSGGIAGALPGGNSGGDVAGFWTPQNGWRGGVVKVWRQGDQTCYSIEVFESITIGQMFVTCVVDGSVPGLKENIEVKFTGRIRAVERSSDPMMKPHRIVLDSVNTWVL